MSLTRWKGYVLVADDSQINQMIVRILLEKKGICVDMADTSDEALVLLQTKRYDLIFINCELASLNGYDLSQAIRSKETSAQHVPIIALTQDTTMDGMLRCVDAGMDDVLIVPLDVNELTYCFERWQAKLTESMTDVDTSVNEEVINCLDVTVLQKLKTDLGSEFDAIFNIAKQTLVTNLAHIKIAVDKLENDSNEELTRYIHSFKSASATIGGNDLSHFSQRLEDYSKTNKVEKLKEQLPRLEEKYNKLKLKLEQWILEYS